MGIVLNLAPFWPEDPADADVVAATDDIDALRNRLWLGPLVDGRYDDRLLAVAPELADPGVVRDGDLDVVRGSADWLGVNYYTPFRTAAPDADATPHPEADAYPGARPVSFVVREPRTDIGWEVDAAGLRGAPGRHPSTHRPADPGHRERRGLPGRRGRPELGEDRRRPGPHRLPARPHRRHPPGA